MKYYIIESTTRGMLIRDHFTAKTPCGAYTRFFAKYAHLGANARNTKIVEIRTHC